VYLVENCVKPLLGGAPDPAILAAQAPNFHKLAGILDTRLKSHQWVAGTQGPSIADIALASPMHLHGWQKLPLDDYSNLRRWMFQGVEQLPSWKKTWVGEGFTTKKA
jgi:glutathione S-transferase